MQIDRIRLPVAIVFCFCWMFESGLSRNKVIEDRQPNTNGIFKKGEMDSFFIGENYTHEESETTLDIKDGIVAAKEEKIYLVKKQDGGLYRKLILKDGIAPAHSKFEPKAELFSFNADFFRRYEFSVQRQEVLGGEKCWALSFEPKKGFPEERWKDRVINNMAGKVWVTQKDLSFKKLAAHLTKEVRYAMPSFTGGRAKFIECVVDAISIDGHFAVSSVRVEYQYSISAFFFPINKHSITTIKYEKYERRTK